MVNHDLSKPSPIKLSLHEQAFDPRVIVPDWNSRAAVAFDAHAQTAGSGEAQWLIHLISYRPRPALA